MRKLSPYEKTHLVRFGKANINIADYGEMPVEYITGKVEFFDRVFEVNKNVLIPRVETEELVKLGLDVILESRGKQQPDPIVPPTAGLRDDTPLTIADIGTGCGAIGITLFLELNKQNIPCQVYLSDIDEKALQITQKNINQLITHNSYLINHNSKINTGQGNLLTQFPNKLRFDLITANLPYIPSERIAYLEKSVKDYEPHIALDGGADGLKLIRQLVSQAKNKLKPNGKIILEIDHTHSLDELKNMSHDLRVEIHKDSFNKSRFAILSN